MGENLLNHCLVRYTEHSITNLIQKCTTTKFKHGFMGYVSSGYTEPQIVSTNLINHQFHLQLNLKFTINIKVITISSIKLWPKISQFHELSRYSTNQFYKTNSKSQLNVIKLYHHHLLQYKLKRNECALQPF